MARKDDHRPLDHDGVIVLLPLTNATRQPPCLIRGRPAGPVFLSGRRPGPACRPAATDLCPATGRARLGYDRARILFTRHTGWELHQLRHSAATHLGEQGIPVQLIMPRPGTATHAPRCGTSAPAPKPSQRSPPCSNLHADEAEQYLPTLRPGLSKGCPSLRSRPPQTSCRMWLPAAIEPGPTRDTPQSPTQPISFRYGCPASSPRRASPALGREDLAHRRGVRAHQPELTPEVSPHAHG